jgi:hypothetical protein
MIANFGCVDPQDFLEEAGAPAPCTPIEPDGGTGGSAGAGTGGSAGAGTGGSAGGGTGGAAGADAG